ncbi:MAG: sigma-70 family RNA polymerase sigma factor [Actinomycetota bacterium]
MTTNRSTSAPSDAELVAGHLAGESAAFAGIYDRYGDRIHDMAAAMLNDRTDAADVLQDVFLVAAERLGQLRDPDRLKPWLFAICRNEVYRRSRSRRRTIATDFTAGPDGYEMADDRLDVEDEVADEMAGEELASLLRHAARGLDERDQMVLELSVRQGLEGQDLADALGVTANQSYTLVHRMRERTERSLAAFAVARAGRKDCATLDDLLRNWDGEFTVLIRKRVARHIDGCDVCDERRGKVAALALFGAAPVLAAPPDLRDRILASARSTGTAPTTPYQFTATGGFPRLVRTARRVAGWVAPAAAASVLLVGAGVVTVIALDDDGDVLRAADVSTTVDDAAGQPQPTTTEVASLPGVPDDDAEDIVDSAVEEQVASESEARRRDPATPDAAPEPAPAAEVPAETPTGEADDASGAGIDAGPEADPPPSDDDGSPDPPIDEPADPLPPDTGEPPVDPPPTEPPPVDDPPVTDPPPTDPPPTDPPPAAPGELSVSAGTLDLGGGAGTSSASVTLSNVGGQPIAWAVSGPPAPFGLSSTGGEIAPGASVQLTATIDRAALGEGDYASTVQVVGPLGPIPLTMSAAVDRGPTFAGAVVNSRCANFGASPVLTIGFQVAISDESDITSASWSVSGGPAGQSGSDALAPDGDWFGAVGFPYVNIEDVNGTWSWSATATDARGNSSTISGTHTVAC